jgi:transcriptional regulator with XRE-family HTH domain
MDALLSTWRYTAGMPKKTPALPSRLRALREAAGLSLRELARQIGEDHSNVRYWETSESPPRSDVLVPMAKALGVTVEDLLGQPTAKRRMTPAGKLGLVFEQVSQLPRRQQEKIVDVVSALVAQHDKHRVA